MPQPQDIAPKSSLLTSCCCRRLRPWSFLQGQQVCSKVADFSLANRLVRFARTWNERLWIAEPRFDPCRSKPIAYIIQAGSNISTGGPDGMARLASILRFE